MDEVVKALAASHFPKSKWLSLGLSLGLLKNTLDEIKANLKDVHECLVECLDKWLCKADNVKQPPSWVTLASALREIEEKAVSENIVEISKNKLYARA